MNSVIIGNGAAGLAAVKSFRKYDKDSGLTVISKEGGKAYSRVLLPYVLRGKLAYDKLFMPYAEEFGRLGVKYLEDEAVNLDSSSNSISLFSGGRINYDNLLIATGSSALWPPIKGIEQPGIYHLWTKSDLDNLMEEFEKGKSVLIIGSGFVSLQAAWAACFLGLKVTLVEIADRIMPLVLDAKASSIMERKMKEHGVCVCTSTITEEIVRDGGVFSVKLNNRKPVEADFVIVGAGVCANISFLEGSGVEHGCTVPVDNYMRTNVKNIYAAGDVAAGPSAFGDEHVTHALWPTAVEMGTVAGANMAGRNISYSGSLNMNVTQMFGVTVASMGKFNDADIDDYFIYDADCGYGYCKLCYKDGFIVGMCLVGTSEAVGTFGKLRPLIRRQISVDCPPSKLDAFLNIRLFEK